ncbi:phosphatidate cytidylyltransferase [Saccharicrinis carchari]|uniref:Phosphatidate cytidylyltransferase n=1 Tax=Saccharicrinis carchari TaxID=1168039 RepID=A0A521EU29_SACCC|nr:phosphatidate cytidylyltransferase [Saccharicrinis carchari]SMO87405.1 phosphatidate cytidylyltransferase [Saccharicrinis carchari]
MSNFWQRLLTGLLFVIVVAGGIYYHPLTYFAIFFLVIIAGVYELNTFLSKAGIKIDFISTLGIAIFGYVAFFLVHSGISKASIYYLFIPLVSVLFIRELFKDIITPFTNIGAGLLCALYIGAPFALMHSLAFTHGNYNFKLPLSVFILVWINDTGAYLSGVSIGRHKFFKRISPKKTWEGTIGGFVITLLAAYVISLFWDDLNGIQWVVFGGIISVMAVLGDLIESMFKRCINIKDSGSFFPGHGGLLDRFDAVIFALPMAVFYIEFFVR